MCLVLGDLGPKFSKLCGHGNDTFYSTMSFKVCNSLVSRRNSNRPRPGHESCSFRQWWPSQCVSACGFATTASRLLQVNEPLDVEMTHISQLYRLPFLRVVRSCRCLVISSLHSNLRACFENMPEKFPARVWCTKIASCATHTTDF